MAHPGEKFYPEGVRWDAPIARGTLPDLLSKAASDFGARTAIEYRDRPISFVELKDMADVAAAAFLRAGYGKNTSVALFLGNSPDHPTNFFGALKAGARVVHLSPLDGAIALTHKLKDSGARILVTSNLSTLLPTAMKFFEAGLLDRLIVCEDQTWGDVGNPMTAIPENPAIVTFKDFVKGAKAPAQWPAIDPDDIALLQYTGGTTGLPKGAMLTHGNLTSAVSIYDVWGMTCNTSGGNSCSDTLYSANGPALGPSFDITRVQLKNIGPATLTFNSNGGARLAYQANGQTITKDFVRFVF